MNENLKQDTAHKLDAFLKGIYMGINAFETFVEKAKNPDLKKLCEDILVNYKRYGEDLANKIKDMNINPSKESAIDIKFGEFFEDIKYMMIHDDHKLHEEVVKALEMALRNSDIFLSKYDINGDNSYKIIKDLIKDNKAFLDKSKTMHFEQ